MTKEKKVSIAIVAALATAWGAAASQGGRALTTPQAPSASTEATSASQVQPVARTHSTQVSAASLIVASTKELLIESRKLDPEQLTANVEQIDAEIAAAQFVERANAGTLRGDDVERFRGLLRRRNAFEIAKTEHMIAAYDAQH